MPTTALHRTLAAALLASAALLPAGCKERDTAPAQESTDIASRGPDAPDGVSVTDGRLILPPVSGNPAAVYFQITNVSDRPLAIAGVAVTGGGMAMLHATRTQDGTAAMEHVEEVPVPAGQTVRFAPGGLHVMVHDLGPAFVKGGTAEVTLTFADGDKVSFPATVQAIGAAS